MDALDKLIEAVEAGTAPEFSIFREAHGKGTVWRSLPSLSRHDAHRAYHGSLDAALALHEALLPGWWLQHLGHCLAGWKVRIETQGKSVPDGMKFDYQPTPARAWLLAILRAYRSIQP